MRKMRKIIKQFDKWMRKPDEEGITGYWTLFQMSTIIIVGVGVLILISVG